jgi:hypothetical protein
MNAATVSNLLIVLVDLFTASPCFDFFQSSHWGRGIVNQPSFERGQRNCEMDVFGEVA